MLALAARSPPRQVLYDPADAVLLPRVPVRPPTRVPLGRVVHPRSDLRPDRFVRLDPRCRCRPTRGVERYPNRGREAGAAALEGAHRGLSAGRTVCEPLWDRAGGRDGAETGSRAELPGALSDKIACGRPSGSSPYRAGKTDCKTLDTHRSDSVTGLLTASGSPSPVHSHSLPRHFPPCLPISRSTRPSRRPDPPTIGSTTRATRTRRGKTKTSLSCMRGGRPRVGWRHRQRRRQRRTARRTSMAHGGKKTRRFGSDRRWMG